MSASGNAKSRMERILRLHEEIDQIKRDIRDIYAEEKSEGGDKTAMGNAIAIIRKRAKDKDAFDEREALTDVYLNAYQAPSHTHAPAREADPCADAKLVETVVKGVQTETGRKALTAAVDVMIEREEAEEAKQSPDPRTSTAAGGQRSIPSVDADDADRAGDEPGHHDAKSTRAATNHRTMHMTPLEPREAGNLKGFGFTVTFEDQDDKCASALRLRPNCQHPGEEICGGQGSNHCHACEKAARQNEVAA